MSPSGSVSANRCNIPVARCVEISEDLLLSVVGQKRQEPSDYPVTVSKGRVYVFQTEWICDSEGPKGNALAKVIEGPPQILPTES